jgi:predicted amino acid-binding ACT domain protein
MKPEEITPETQLCTIIGYNAQTGLRRKYFNKILKSNGINATAIALNITDEHFTFTMSNVANSKVDRMIIEPEFQSEAVAYCQNVEGCTPERNHVEFIEVVDGNIVGYCLEEEAKALFSQPELIDEQALFIARLMLLAHRWYGVEVDLDEIPLLLA